MILYLLLPNIILIIILIAYYQFRVSWILNKRTIKDYWRQIQEWRERVKKQINPNVETDILNMLSEGKELCFLDILNQLNHNRLIPLSFGVLSPTLNRLERNKLIKWDWGKEKGNEGKKYIPYLMITLLN